MNVGTDTTAANYDVAIIGAGPGGAAAALTAGALGLRVLLVDPRLAPLRSGASKPCGEGLMPAGVDTLRTLGLNPETLGLSFPGVRYFAPGAGSLDLDFPEPGFAIQRGVLQRALDQRIAKEPTVECLAAVARVQPWCAEDTAGYLVDAGGHTFRAGALIVADGGGGRCAAWLRSGAAGREEPRQDTGGVEPRRERVPRAVRAQRARRAGRVGLRVHCEVREPLDRVEVHFGAGCEVYLTPLPRTPDHPRGLVNVVLLFERLPEGIRGGVELLRHALAAHPAAVAHIGDPVGPIEARALAWPTPARIALGRCFLVGDAGGGVDPVLGCGTTVALRSGVAAALGVKALEDGVDPRRVARDYRRVHRRETAARRRVAAVLIVAARRPFTARSLVRLARALPRSTRSLVALAARVEPLCDRSMTYTPSQWRRVAFG